MNKEFRKLLSETVEKDLNEHNFYLIDFSDIHLIYHRKSNSTIEIIQISKDKYLGARAYDELSEYIRALPDYTLYERAVFLKECNLFKSRKNQNFAEYKNSMMQIAEIYQSQGLNFNYFQTLMQIADEAYFFPPYVCGEREGLPVSEYENEVKEIVESAEKIGNKFYGYPQIAEIHLQFCFIYLCLGDFVNAKRHLDYFDSLKLPLLRFHHIKQDRYNFMKKMIKNHNMQ